MNTRRENKPAAGSIESIPASRFPLHKRNGVLYCFDEPHLKSIIHSSLFSLLLFVEKVKRVRHSSANALFFLIPRTRQSLLLSSLMTSVFYVKQQRVREMNRKLYKVCTHHVQNSSLAASRETA